MEMLYVNHHVLAERYDWKHDCPDRCDLHFDYAWNKTNLYLNYINSDPQYFLNAGDTIRIELKNVSPQKVFIVNGDKKIELTNVSDSFTLVDDNGKSIIANNTEVSTNTDSSIDDNTWVGAIPTTWDSQGTFAVVMECHGTKMLLYEGLLNKYETTYKNVGDMIISSDDGSIKITSTSYGYDLSISSNNGLVAESGDGKIYLGNKDEVEDILKDTTQIDTGDLVDYNGEPNTSSQDD